jgi:hypothetical protein
MDRTFELFRELKMVQKKPKQGDKVEKGDLIPYYFDGKNVPQYYNTIRVIPDLDFPPEKKFLTAKDFNIPNLPGQ